jgi:hypothetical protein
LYEAWWKNQFKDSSHLELLSHKLLRVCDCVCSVDRSNDLYGLEHWPIDYEINQLASFLNLDRRILEHIFALEIDHGHKTSTAQLFF